MDDAFLEHEEKSRSIVGGFFEVYNVLGYGFLEYIYRGALQVELRQRGHVVQREVPVPIAYKGFEIAIHRMDMVIDSAIVIEVKATPVLHPSARRQLLNYLKATNIEVGLLLHFGPEAKFYRQVLTRRRRRISTRAAADPRESARSAKSAFPMGPTRNR